MSTAHRFLGFAFAAADLLVEVTAEGRIAFAMGAGEALIGMSDARMTGCRWTDLIDPSDHAMTEALFCGLRDGARAGPVAVKIKTPDGAPERFVNVTAMRLPQNQRAVSCVLSRASARGPVSVQSRESFEARASALVVQAPQDLELAFIELAGLSSTEQALSDPEGLLVTLLPTTVRSTPFTVQPPAKSLQPLPAMPPAPLSVRSPLTVTVQPGPQYIGRSNAPPATSMCPNVLVTLGRA